VISSTVITASIPASFNTTCNVYVNNPAPQGVSINGMGYAYLGPDSFTKLLLHMDGAGSSFFDNSGSHHGLTASGDPTQSTAQAKFGGKSGYFNGSSYLSMPSNDFNPGTGDFTIDFWAFNAPAIAVGNNKTVLSAGDNTNGGWYVYFHSSLGLIILGIPQVYSYISLSGASSGWSHFAVVRTGGTMKMYIDGLSKTVTGVAGGFDLFNMTYTGEARIGNDNASNYTLTGYIHELRFSNIARWTTDFPPPSGPYY
jgi:hypothetical protein